MASQLMIIDLCLSKFRIYEKSRKLWKNNNISRGWGRAVGEVRSVMGMISRSQWTGHYSERNSIIYLLIKLFTPASPSSVVSSRELHIIFSSSSLHNTSQHWAPSKTKYWIPSSEITREDLPDQTISLPVNIVPLFPSF